MSRLCIGGRLRLLLLVAAFLPLGLFATDASAARTRIVRVEPFGAAGRLAPGWTVSTKASGYCFGGASATSRRDAYRCILKHFILDPCFADPRGISTAYVLCVQTPWRHQAIKLHLTQPLPAANAGRHAGAWAMMLPHGVHCWVNTGTGLGVISGRLATWYCDHGGADGGAVAQGLHRGNPWWVWYAPRIVSSGATLTAKWRRVTISWLYT